MLATTKGTQEKLRLTYSLRWEWHPLESPLVVLVQPCSSGQCLKPLSMTYLSSHLSFLLILKNKTKNPRRFSLSPLFSSWLDQKRIQLFSSNCPPSSPQIWATKSLLSQLLPSPFLPLRKSDSPGISTETARKGISRQWGWREASVRNSSPPVVISHPHIWATPQVMLMLRLLTPIIGWAP